MKSVIINVCDEGPLLCKFRNEYWERHQPCGGHVYFSSSIKNGIPGVSASAFRDKNYEIDARWC